MVWEGRKSTLRTKKRSKKGLFSTLLDQLWTKKVKNRHTFFTFSTISGAIFGTKCFRSPFHNRGGVHTENEGRDLTFKLIRYCLDTAPPPLPLEAKKGLFSTFEGRFGPNLAILAGLEGRFPGI